MNLEMDRGDMMAAIGEQALRAERARQAARDLRATRRAMVCQDSEERDDGGWVTLPCFYLDDEERRRESCATCREREVVHAAYGKAANRKRIERLKLTRMCSRYLETKEAGK